MTDNDNDPLCVTARTILRRMADVLSEDTEDPMLTEALEEYLIGLKPWIPLLLGPMPFTSVDLEMSAYEVFVRVFLADLGEAIGKSPKIMVVSPSHYTALHKRYVAATDAIAEMGWRLSSTSYTMAITDGQRKRQRGCEVIQQEMLLSLLRSILPAEHFEAVKAIGIDAADWHERQFGLAFGLKLHHDDMAARQSEFADHIRIGKREKSAADAIFIRDLAKLWMRGFQSKPISWHNPLLETNSAFYDFVSAAWKMRNGEFCPSADTISEILNSGNIS